IVPSSLEHWWRLPVLVLSAWPFHDTEGAVEVLNALAAPGRTVVYLSSTAVNDAGPQSDLIPLLHAEMEALVAAATTEWTVVRADALASNSLSLARQVRAGDVVRATEVAPSAVVDEGDVAAVAVRVLTEPGHLGRTYLVTGPQVIGRAERVAAIGAALGRSLRFEVLPVEVARETMRAAGLPERQIESLVSMTEFRPRSELITDTVAEFTGRPARDIREWSVEHVEDFR
ncbi:NADPH:quinone reductase, partial [Nocardia sp. NPDC004722]